MTRLREGLLYAVVLVVFGAIGFALGTAIITRFIP